MNDKQSRAMVVFAAALDLPPGERAAYLAQACGDDEALKARVEALLRADSEAGQFMEQPPRAALAAATSVIGEKPGDRIGRYKLLQQIGEGGCGVVFMAEQEEPVRRKVALKIIKPGMDTKSVIARFEAERQALALMDHPNIAKVFDAGATELGRPFFVMELIRGIKITDYCDQHSLATPERLELFVQVCQAVQHAHQKGVIHRDIKPSNILVTTTDEGAALPVVIDFGIAKPTTDQRLTDKTLFTAFDMMIGTPAYMSPEQAALTRADVDTRTDIYSLGVLLYELLTGSTPFDVGELLKAGFDEIRRVIREKEPARPSTRLNTMAAGTLTTVAQHRRTEPPNLIRVVRGDLDWIVMRALEKDRTRRYDTANGLAMDVRRYLANELVTARPPSKLYKLQKTIQRNKILFSGIGVIVVLLVVSLAVVAASLAQERKARLAAQTEEERSRQVTRFLENMLEGVGPSVARGRNTEMLREILDKTAQQIGEQIGNQPAVEVEIRSLIAGLYLEIGNYSGAEAMARTALDLQRKLRGKESGEAAAALNTLGGALWKQRNLTEAEAAYGEALAIRRQLFGNDHVDVATTLNNLGAVYRRQRKLTESEALTRESLDIRRRLLGNEHLDVADSLRNLAIVLGDRGAAAESELAAREMVAIRRRLLGSDHPLVALGLVDLAWVLGGNPGEAETLELEAFGIQWKVLANEHPDLARSIYLQGERLRNRGDLVESHAVLNAALSLQRRLLGEDHPDVLATLRGLSSILEQEGNWVEMERVYREALELRRKEGGPPSSQVAFATLQLFRALRKQDKTQEAEQLLMETLTPAFLNNPVSADLLKQRVDLMGRRGQWKDAVTNAARLVEHRPDDHFAYLQLAVLLAATHNRPAYEELCRRMVAAFPEPANPFCAERIALTCVLLPDLAVDLNLADKLADTALTRGGKAPYFQVCKAMACYRLKRYADAVTWAEQARDKTPAYTTALTCAILAMAHWQLGHPIEARALLAEGEQLAPVALPDFIAQKNDASWLAWLMGRIVLDEAKLLIESLPSERSLDKP